MKIFIKTLTGKTYEIEIYCFNTILQLKEIIEKATDIPVNQMRLTYFSKSLDDDKTLSEYNINKNDTINLILILRGGESINFNFSNMTNVKEIDFSKKLLPDYCAVGKGINFVCKCYNSHCDTKNYGGGFYIMQGFGEFNIGETLKEPIKCVACGIESRLRTVGFTDCCISFVGEYTNGKLKNGEKEFDENKFYQFSDSEQNLVSWKRLVINVYERMQPFLSATEIME